MDTSSDLAPEGPLGSPAQTEPKDIDHTEKKVRFDTAIENAEEDGRYQSSYPSTPRLINENPQKQEEEDSP
jgi:hypothetical protein